MWFCCLSVIGFAVSGLVREVTWVLPLYLCP